MKRVWASLAILLAIALVTVYGALAVDRTTRKVDDSLRLVQELASGKDYDAARRETQALLAYWQQAEHQMAIFLRRDHTNALTVDLATIDNYLEEEYQGDLSAEVNRARAQVELIRHLYFSLV